MASEGLQIGMNAKLKGILGDWGDSLTHGIGGGALNPKP